MCKKLILLIILLSLLCTACEAPKNINYTIEETDEEIMNQYETLWSEEESQWIQDNKNRFVIFACTKDYIPLEYSDKTAAYGIGVNVLKQVSKTTGLKFKLYENNLNEEWHSLINLFKEKKIDILPTVSYSNERTLFLDFTIPYIQTSLAIIGHEDNINLQQTLEHIKNHTIAIPKGYWLNEYLRRKTHDNIYIYEVNSTKEAFDAINKKKAEYTISEIPVFTYYRELETYKHLRIVGEITDKNPIMIGVQKDLPILKSIINKVIINSDKSQLFEASLLMPSKNINKKLLIIILLLTIIIVIIGYLLLRSLLNLLATKRLLEINIKQKEQFMEDISHDLKTPIMIIMGYIDTIADGEVRDQTYIQNYLKRVQSITLYIQSLVNDLFMLSKLKNDFIKLHKEKTYINKLIEEVASIIKINADKKNIPIIMNLELTIHTQIEIDSFRIRQVFNNILYNAVKYTSDGGKIIISTKSLNNGKTRISIEDSGRGISPEDLPLVFDRYYKSQNNKDPQSSGLGLSIAKQLIIMHDGRIWAESPPGKGSTFFIEI